MTRDFRTDNPELEALFDRYRAAPHGHVFAPLADACRKAGMLEEAIEICEKGVSTHPRYASGFVVRGKCYYDLGNADQAEASFEKVLELDANNLVALRYMGLMFAERGDAAEARRRFERILALDPDNAEIAEKLEELEQLAELAEPSAPSEEESMRGLIDDDVESPAEETDDRVPGADDSFVAGEIALGQEAPTPDVLATMTLAEIYASQGYRSKAIKIFREMLAADPQNDVAARRLRELGESRVEDTGARDTSTVLEASSDAFGVDQGNPTTPAAGLSAVEPREAAAPKQRPAAGAGGTPSPHRPVPRGRARPRESEIENDASVNQFKRWLDNLHR